jgi:hypothetical protein
MERGNPGIGCWTKLWTRFSWLNVGSNDGFVGDVLKLSVLAYFLLVGLCDLRPLCVPVHLTYQLLNA